jgi:ribosomal protein S27AE
MALNSTSSQYYQKNKNKVTQKMSMCYECTDQVYNAEKAFHLKRNSVIKYNSRSLLKFTHLFI